MSRTYISDYYCLSRKIKKYVILRVQTFLLLKLFFMKPTFESYVYMCILQHCNLRGECPGVVDPLVAMLNRGESFLEGSFASSRLEGGL